MENSIYPPNFSFEGCSSQIVGALTPIAAIINNLATEYRLSDFNSNKISILQDIATLRRHFPHGGSQLLRLYEYVYTKYTLNTVPGEQKVYLNSPIAASKKEVYEAV